MRYAFYNAIKPDRELSFDCVIIGTGLAGLYTALNIDSKFSCCLITKEGVDLSNSWLAQGGIAAAINSDDTPLFHLEDTLIAGAGLCDEEAVKVLVDEGPKDIRTLVEMKVPFDLNTEGDLLTTREGGHRHNRIVHAGGDATGRETVKALSVHVLNRPNTVYMEYTLFIDILTNQAGHVCGLVIRDQNDRYVHIKTSNIVLATGGIGQVYKISTNPYVATGDGIAAAVRAGAKLKDIEFVQFHPTGLYSESGDNRAFLISEAMRGEGALLKNREGVRFMLGKHELNELAPRDIVARGVIHELERSGDTNVFLDITNKPEEFLSKRFPTIYNECLRHGINIAKEWIPVVPVQHYLMGGVKTGLYGQTSIPGLYACGETACTGVHGANRLASNSMLECLVFGRRAAADISLSLQKKIKFSCPFPETESRPILEMDYFAERVRLQNIMHMNCGAIRTLSGLRSAKIAIDALFERLNSGYGPGKEYLELLNIVTVAKAIVEAALGRPKSIGAHYIEEDESYVNHAEFPCS
jgi:L-aspartate oxidase